jgi:glycosyltransferase involved in cell wall biosynthesis
VRVLALTHVFPRAEGDPTAPFLLRWAQALSGAGAKVSVVAPHDAGLPPRHVVGGIPVRRARYAPDRWERLAYRGRMDELARGAAAPLLAGLAASLAAAVRAQVRAGGPDLLHVHWWLPGAVVARLARPGIPVVLTVHGTDVALLERRPALAVLAGWALAAVDRVEAVSTDLAERLERATGRPADAVAPMPLAIEPQPLRAREDGALHVLAAGRLVADKGFTDLVAAVARLRPPVSLTIAGEGPQRRALAARASTLDVDLDLPGALSPGDLAHAYACADIVAQPSHREGLGLVAAEALATGVPVVATDAGGVRDLLPRQELLPPGDVPALSAALAAVAADLPAARAQAARRGAAIRTRLSPESVGERAVRGYQQV